jgi:hypothetical protein
MTVSCATVAAVIAHAPASSWRRIRAGAIEVLPCGASETPRASHQACISRRLWATALSRSTISGSATSRI